MTQRNFKGSNYDDKLTTKEIAKLTRKFVKDNFPGCKFSIRSTYNSIRLELLNAPEATDSGIKERCGEDMYWLTDYGKDMYSKINNFLESYNHDRSDIMTDYFDVNFYKTIDLTHYVTIIK